MTINAITEDDVKIILRNKDKLLQSFQRKQVLLHDEIAKDTAYYSIPSSPNMDGMPHGTGGTNDISSLYESCIKEQERSMSELAEAVRELNEQMSIVKRVWQCYLALPEPYLSVLEDLYVKDNPFDVAMKHQQLSRGAFNNRRKKAIELILQYYYSDYSLAQLIRSGKNKNV